MKKLLLLATLSISTCLFSNEVAHDSYERIDDSSELTILNPSLSERRTAKLHLANGLEAYLVSDPGVEQSSAALAVGAGSWDDPAEYPGMAHFLEHMLFMGTKAYPSEFEYMQYIGDHGGKVNAYTASDRTVYMFSVNNDGFTEALDRLSHFFIDPLFLPSSIERELHAVDQEHSKNIENDGWRQYMVFKETGNQNHPNAKFSTGNADTLRGIPQDAMKAWYKEHYSSDKMHLVILSSLPLDELIEQTVHDFSRVPRRETSHESYPTRMISNHQKGHLIYVKPVKDLKTLSLTWELPENLAVDQDAKAGELLAYILQSGAKNSLLATLKKASYASAISVTQEAFAKNNKLFCIDVELSNKGLKNIDRVISYCFEALARLKREGIPSYIFNEVKKISEIQYEYQSRNDAFEFVRRSASDLMNENIATYPRKTLIPTSYEPEVLSAYIDALSAQDCIYFVIANPTKSGVPPTYKEKWMGAEYAIKEIPQKELLAWSHASINPKIGLPPENPFIPKNLQLVHHTDPDAKVTPVLLQENTQGKIYYSEDQKYSVPEIAHIFRIKTPLLDGSAKAKALSDLYTKALDDQLFPITNAAGTAGLKVAFSEANLSYQIAINGYSDQSDRLVLDIFNELKQVRPSKEQFALYKQSIAANYKNASKELPLLQSFELLNNIIFSNAPTSKERKAALKEITYEEFNRFSKELFKKAYIEGLLSGNLTKKKAKTLLTAVNKKLKAKPYLKEERQQRQILILPEASGPYMVMQPTPMQGNGVVLMIEQGPYSFEKRGCQQILGKVLKDDFFDTLRTKQQVAYIAKAWEKEEEGQLLQFFAVQSSSHSPSELIGRFELFLEDFQKQYTTKLTHERFEKIRQMSIATLQMPPENLMLMASRLFLLGFDYNADFDLVEKRIAALRNLTYEQTREEAIQTLSRMNSRRIAVLVEGLTPKEKEFRYELVSKEDLQDYGTFVAWR